MFESSKLRSNATLTGIAQPVIALIIYAIIWALYGITWALVGLGVIFGIYAILSLAYLFRTRNPWFFVTFIYQVTIIFGTFLAPRVGLYAIPKDNFKPLVLLVVVEMAVMIYIMVNKKLKWRGWEVLEMAARNINEATNGFTDRPRPLGKVNCTRSELVGFSDFLKSKLIAFSIEETDRIIIIPITMGDDYRIPLGLSKNYSEDTRVEFGIDGNVSAQIAKKDYLKYNEALAFDQLVESLGELFISFFEQYQKGEEIRIMYEIEKIKTHPFN